MKADGEAIDDGVDLGVERLLRLLWLFRRPGQTRTRAQVIACGYPNIQDENSVGRKNYYNDRTRLAELGVVVKRDRQWTIWQVSGALDDVTLILTPEERNALTEARLLVADDDSQPEAPQPASADRTGAHGVPSAVPMILAAISDKRPVRFAYNGRERYVDPYRVAVSSTNRWHLLGIDRDLAATRTFRIDRISDLTSDRDATVPPCPTDASWPLHPVAWGGTDPVMATVHFPHEPLPEWLAMLGTPSPGPSPDERSFAVANHAAFVRRTLAIGATIVSPPSLVDLAKSTLDAHMRAYGPR